MPAPAAPGDSTGDLWGNPAHLDRSRRRRRPQQGLCCLLPPRRTEPKNPTEPWCLPGQGGPTSTGRYQCTPRIDKWGRGNVLQLTSDSRCPRVIACPLQQRVHEPPSPSTHPTHPRPRGRPPCLSPTTSTSKHSCCRNAKLRGSLPLSH